MRVSRGKTKRTGQYGGVGCREGNPKKRSYNPKTITYYLIILPLFFPQNTIASVIPCHVTPICQPTLLCLPP